MLDSALKDQLKTYMEWITKPIEIVASLDDSDKSREMSEMLGEIKALSDKVAVNLTGVDAYKPSFAIKRIDEEIGEVRFAGIPMGHEFTSLILALLQAGGHAPKITDEEVKQIKQLSGEYQFKTYISLSCQNCPTVVQALNTMAVLNPKISNIIIDGAVFTDEVNSLQIMAVPSVYLNGETFEQGRMTLQEILAKLDTGASQREAEKINAKEPFDVLVVGGGPAGAAAAIYSARKGIRTGMAAERLGGQVQDTMAIENFIATLETDGPTLASQLEAHVRSYDVDLMPLQVAEKLVPASAAGQLHEVHFKDGAVAKAKTVIISTGAHWRKVNVPGEEEYRAKGVAYCPHCDGPLFKGKKVAVIGGGNSGVEAAIDLAGIVSHVTLLEFADELKADAILQDKLRSLDNVTIVTQAQTLEIKGDGSKVVGLSYKNTKTGAVTDIELAGIFVQIGLLPNSHWVKGVLELNKMGEIVVDDRGRTSVAGIFAAGDVTTVPYKQIVIAVGEGAKASLSAFDYLIRSGH